MSENRRSASRNVLNPLPHASAGGKTGSAEPGIFQRNDNADPMRRSFNGNKYGCFQG